MSVLPLRSGPRGRRGRRTRPVRLLSGALALTLAAGACGGSAESSLEVPDGPASQASDESVDVLASRTGAGIAAAGGDLTAFDASECALNRAVRLAYVGPDLSRLDSVGLGSLVVEEPAHIIAAYLTELNANGGLHGRCVQSSVHLWSWEDPESSFQRICDQVPAESPIVVLNLFGDVRGVSCLATDAGLAMFGLYASVPATIQRLSRGNLFLDVGTAGYLLGNSIDIALRSGLVPESGQFGLLFGGPLGADPTSREYNIGADFDQVVEVTGDLNRIPGVITHVPARFGQLPLLGPEGRVRLLESALTPAEVAAATEEASSLTAAQTAILGEIEQFYLDAARDHRDKGVIAVYSTAPWFELRRMMRAAERIGWHPLWIANDIQGATLTLTGAPRAQADNFYLVSARRAAGDEFADLDRGCVGLRSAATGSPPFTHRHHTDAWSVLVATCDALDVTMSALSRVSGPLSAEAFVEQLSNTHYEAGYGGRIGFGPGDYSGADRFRVLRADPGCVLDDWGCMRAVTDWFEPSVTQTQGGG